MPCYAPWVPRGSYAARPLACGQCIGCRLEYSRQWAVRIMHEAKMHEVNSFVTLTYREAPESLRYSDYQAFMRRLRRSRGKVRFFCGGEYGEQGGRPHFHAVLFGVSFEDRAYFGKSPAGFRLYRSDALSELWSLGFSSVGDVSFESAAYVARYVVKKVTGDAAGAHYAGRVPEFARMSLKPGIGAEWFERFGKSDVLPRGKVIVNGVEASAPRYYRRKLKLHFPLAYRRLMAREELAARELVKDSAPGRLEAKEAVQVARLGMLKRKI